MACVTRDTCNLHLCCLLLRGKVDANLISLSLLSTATAQCRQRRWGQIERRKSASHGARVQVKVREWAASESESERPRDSSQVNSLVLACVISSVTLCMHTRKEQSWKFTWLNLQVYCDVKDERKRRLKVETKICSRKQDTLSHREWQWEYNLKKESREKKTPRQR